VGGLKPDELTPVDSDDPGWRRYRALVDGRPFDVEVSARWARTATDAQSLADRLFPQLVGDRATLTGYCAADLLEDHNQEWGSGEQLDERDFRSRLTFIGFGVMPDGHVRARFADDGMFRGHDVVVDLDPELRHVYTMLE
jgi:hypothetical protein